MTQRIDYQKLSTPGLRALFLGISGLIADLAAMVTLQLTRHARWRAIQSCRDLADRLAGFAKTGNRAALFKRDLVIMLAHRNTLVWCCTSFVSLGGPLRPQKRSLASLRMTAAAIH